MTSVAQDADRTPTEIPERLFRQSAAYAEIREIAREAEAARANARREAASDKVLEMTGGAASPVVGAWLAVAGNRTARRALVAAAVVGWALVIAMAIKWSGLV